MTSERTTMYKTVFTNWKNTNWIPREEKKEFNKLQYIINLEYIIQESSTDTRSQINLTTHKVFRQKDCS